MLLEIPLEQLYEQLKASEQLGTKSLALLDPRSEKTATSIRSTAASYVECLSFLEDTKQPFSIREWIQNDKQDQ